MASSVYGISKPLFCALVDACWPLRTATFGQNGFSQSRYEPSSRWELVIFDEAHKPHNLYKKDGNITARNIHQATLHAESKILLSATPIQNNLMEPYGLAKVIDEHFLAMNGLLRFYTQGRKRARPCLKI